MKRQLFIFLLIVASLCFWGCAQESQQTTEIEQGEYRMKIDGVSVDISWEDNKSVHELLQYAKNGVEINMHQYGGFEQVGSIGKKISSYDKQMTTHPGDVVLYDSNQIVIFFGQNNWSYTKLGHINLSEAELEDLLNKSSVNLYLGEK